MKGMLKHYVATLKHKALVSAYAAEFAARLILRSFLHDMSKFGPAEARGFAQILSVLGKHPYGSPEYKESLKSGCIELHYRRNRHHPEHHRGGLGGMTLLDVVEMWCDWQAAVRRSGYDCLVFGEYDPEQPPIRLCRLCARKVGIDAQRVLHVELVVPDGWGPDALTLALRDALPVGFRLRVRK